MAARKIPLNQKTLSAIGLVTYQWSLLEDQVALGIGWCAQISDFEALRTMTVRVGFPTLLDMLENLVRFELQGRSDFKLGTTLFNDIINDIRDLQGWRNRIAHGKWSKDAYGPILVSFPPGAYRIRRDPMGADHLESLAIDIGDATNDLRDFYSEWHLTWLRL